jgi:hypothetical protein
MQIASAGFCPLILLSSHYNNPASNHRMSSAGRHRLHHIIATKTVRACLLAAMALVLTACAVRPYQGVDVDSATFLGRAKSSEQDNLRISAAVPDATETKALTGLDLYAMGIQPVWLKLESAGTSGARVALWSIDRDYFSPIEVAYMNRKKFSAQGYRDMERWFHDNGLPRRVPAGKTVSGLVFTNLRRGTKGFNVDVFSPTDPSSFTFFIPLPGFTADYMEVDFETIYSGQTVPKLSREALQTALENDLSCCVTDSSGTFQGGPINAVLVGTPKAVRRSLLRGNWS